VRHAEVGELREPRAGRGLGDDHHVLGLHVAVDHLASVRVRQGVAQRRSDARHVAVRQRTATQELAEGAPAHELRHQVDRVFVGAELVQPDDPRMVQPRRHPCFTLYPGRYGILTLAGDDLDRHLPLQALVERLPDHAEAAGAQAPLEAVAVQDEAARGGPRGRGPQLPRRGFAFHVGFDVLLTRAPPCPLARRCPAR
jgi:hypothetical protein